VRDDHWHSDGRELEDGEWLQSPAVARVVDPMTRLEGIGQALEFDVRVPRPTAENGALEVYRRALVEATRMNVELAIEDTVDDGGNLFTRVRMVTRRGDVVVPVEIENGQTYAEVWHAAFRKLGLLD
jgi:hypothetical protein